jgi:SAM-dependent methyltransferase
MNIDIGKYNLDPKLYKELIGEMYNKYPNGINLPPEYANFIHENLIHFLIRLSRYKFVARQLKSSDDVLEIGCGSGLGSIFLSQYCSSVIAIDTKGSEIKEAIAMNKRDNLKFEQRDLFEFSDKKKYNVIVAMDVIEHLEEEDAKKMLNKMTSLLKEDGILAIGTPSKYSYPYQGELSKASHVKCYDKDELIKLVEQFCCRTLFFSMNDEIVHTGHHKMGWYYFVLAFLPRIK